MKLMIKYLKSDTKSYYVYILKCSDKSYYIGITNNIERRIWEHNQGLIKGYTQKRKPLKLVYFQEFKNINEAIAFEKQIKGWSRAKKEALIKNDIKKLKELSRKKQYRSSPFVKLRVTE